MAYQNLFNTVADITGHHLLESEMSEIIDALQNDIDEQKPTNCNHEWIENSGLYFCRHCSKPKYDYPLL